MLTAKKILIGVTGSIAAYKIAHLTRLLIKAGAEVRIIMTKSATEFIAPLTLATLSKNEVLTDLSDNSGTWANHVMLGRWADVMLIAPASCNTIAKMAAGICDNLLMAVYLSATCKVIVAPAMDEDMWKHPATRRNLDTLESFKNKVLSVNNGELASGLIGEGRMAEPEEIFEYLSQQLTHTVARLKGKSVLITAGPTQEAIDPVRYISNHSTGKMGIAIAESCKKQGADVTLVLGPSAEKPPTGVKVVHVVSADEMYNACVKLYPKVDIAILSAAVADYSPESVAKEKIKKKEQTFSIKLAKTKDILRSLGEKKKAKQVLVGFALETNNEKDNALGKLKSKNADIIVLNSLRDAGAGFGYDTNKITIFDRRGNEKNFAAKQKSEVADDIVNYIIDYVNE